MADVAAQLQPGATIVAEVMGKNGVVYERVVRPRSFDPSNPQSLLGCQITDMCPIRFTPHPAMRGVTTQRQAPNSSNGVQEVEEQRDPESQNRLAETEPQAPAAMSSREFLHQLPSWHDEDVAPRSDDEASLEDHECGNGGKESFGWNEEDRAWEESEQVFDHEGAAKGEVAADESLPADLATESGDVTDTRWRSRCVLMLASLLNLGHGAAFLAAPSFGSEAKAVVHAFRQDLWRLATASCGADASSDAAVRRAAADEPDPEAPPLKFGDFVHIAMAVSCLELLLAASGMALALLPRGGSGRRDSLRCCRDMRCALAVVYPPTALLLWLALAAMTTYFLAFRWDADDLVQRYWDCLEGADHSSTSNMTHSTARRYFESVDVIAAVCLSADMSAVLGLFAACALIGWRHVLQASVTAFGALSAVGGGLLASLGVALRDSRREMPSVAADSLVYIGGFMLIGGVLGVLAARSERRWLLQLHSVVLALASLVVGLGSAILLTGGADLAHRLLSGILGDVESSDVAVEDTERLFDLMQAHRLSLSVASVLGLFLLVVNGSMVVALRTAVTAVQSQGGAGGAYQRVVLEHV